MRCFCSVSADMLRIVYIDNTRTGGATTHVCLLCVCVFVCLCVFPSRCDSPEKLKALLPRLEQELKDGGKFKDFYQFTFNFAKNPGQKGLGKPDGTFE